MSIKHLYQLEDMSDVFGCVKIFDTKNGITMCSGCHKKLHFGGDL